MKSIKSQNNTLQQFDQDSDHSYVQMCKVIKAIEQIDVIDMSQFLKTYIGISPSVKTELLSLESTLGKMQNMCTKLMCTVQFYLLNEENRKEKISKVYYGIDEAAQKLHMSSRTLQRRIKEGEIACSYKNPELKRGPIFSEEQINNYFSHS